MNSFNCPSCKKDHSVDSYNSMIICDNCLEIYPLLNNYNENVKFKCMNNAIYAFTINSVTQKRECFINGIPCYCTIGSNYRRWYIVASIIIK